jgi:hypothetical protein
VARTPDDLPAVAVSRDRPRGRATGYVSWNGEAAINLGTGQGHGAVMTLDGHGHTPGRSRIVAG